MMTIGCCFSLLVFFFFLQCQFWIVNNTGLPLLVRDPDDNKRVAAGQSLRGYSALDSADVMREFVDAPPLLFNRGALRIKVADSRWSSRIRLPAIGSGGLCLDLSTESDARSFGVALTARTVAGGRFHASTAIVVSPRFVVRNEASRALLLRQCGTGEHRALLAGRSMPWHWPSRVHAPLLQLSALDPRGAVSWRWSGALSMAELEAFCIKIDGGGTHTLHINWCAVLLFCCVFCCRFSSFASFVLQLLAGELQ